jgi:hypothetical protein
VSSLRRPRLRYSMTLGSPFMRSLLANSSEFLD